MSETEFYQSGPVPYRKPIMMKEDYLKFTRQVDTTFARTLAMICNRRCGVLNTTSFNKEEIASCLSKL